MLSQFPATQDYTPGHTEPRGRVYMVEGGGLDAGGQCKREARVPMQADLHTE